MVKIPEYFVKSNYIPVGKYISGKNLQYFTKIYSIPLLHPFTLYTLLLPTFECRLSHSSMKSTNTSNLNFFSSIELGPRSINVKYFFMKYNHMFLSRRDIIA